LSVPHHHGLFGYARHRSNLAGIGGDNEAVYEVEVRVDKGRCRAENLFDVIEGFLVLGDPYPWGILEG
jgi:hypothetical protein